MEKFVLFWKFINTLMSSPKIPNPIFQSFFFKKMGRTVSLSNLEAWDCIQNLTFPKSQWTTLKFIEKQSEMMLSYQQCLILLYTYCLAPPLPTFLKSIFCLNYDFWPQIYLCTFLQRIWVEECVEAFDNFGDGVARYKTPSCFEMIKNLELA